jgi:predicted site-specific integrase-resolvase
MSLNKNEIREKYASVSTFLKKEQGKHRCQCGCDEVIDLKQSHFWNGIPRFIFGHAARLRQGAKSFDTEQFYCVEDIAKIAGVSDQTVRLWNRNGFIIAAETTGRKNLYNKTDIEAFLTSRPERCSFDPELYYSVQELKQMGVSRGKLRVLARAGKIQNPRHHARKTYYLKSEIDKYLNDILDDSRETRPRSRVTVSVVNNLQWRISELEERVKLLEDSLLGG